MSEMIYVDHAATTPVCKVAQEAMIAWTQEGFGNPSSQHAAGRKSRAAIDEAREVLASRFGCLFGEVIFTGGGTEAANLAILGHALELKKSGNPRNQVIVGAGDHHCVLHLEPLLRAIGFEMLTCRIDGWARMDTEHLSGLLGDETAIVCVIYANNEVGTIQDVRAISDLAHAHGAAVFCDAVQAFGVLDAGVDALGVDMMAVTAHKLYGPKGVGALYLRSGVLLEPWLRGGGQERDMRPGTENTAAIMGFAAAIRGLEPLSRDAVSAFWEELGEGPWIRTLPPDCPTLPGHAHLIAKGRGAESLLIHLDRLGICASGGSACSSGSVNPSHVLKAIGFGEEDSTRGVRFSFGRGQGSDVGQEVARRLKSILLK